MAETPRFPGEGNGNPLQYSCLENPMDGETWQAPVLGAHKIGRNREVALMVKNPPANAGDLRDTGLSPGLERSPGGGHGNPLPYSCLENSTDRGAWGAIVHEVAESDTAEVTEHKGW